MESKLWRVASKNGNLKLRNLDYADAACWQNSWKQMFDLKLERSGMMLLLGDVRWRIITFG
jgi:hypothetical protein